MASNKTIAIVDDDAAVRDALRFLLDIGGHDVETFASASDFLAAGPERFASLIVDYHMPAMTGLELADRLRNEGLRIPILLISADLSPAIAARAAAIGVDKISDKPLDDHDVLAFVDRVDVAS